MKPFFIGNIEVTQIDPELKTITVIIHNTEPATLKEDCSAEELQIFQDYHTAGGFKVLALLDYLVNEQIITSNQWSVNITTSKK